MLGAKHPPSEPNPTQLVDESLMVLLGIKSHIVSFRWGKNWVLGGEKTPSIYIKAALQPAYEPSLYRLYGAGRPRAG